MRDEVRVYNGSLRFPMTGYRRQDYAEDVRRMMALPEEFTIIKQPISFHSPMKREVPGYYYGKPELSHFHGTLAGAC